MDAAFHCTKAKKQSHSLKMLKIRNCKILPKLSWYKNVQTLYFLYQNQIDHITNVERNKKKKRMILL